MSVSHELTPDQKARVQAAFKKALGPQAAPRRKPTRRQIDAALDVLLWLSAEESVDGQMRDAIGAVRHELDQRIS